MFIIEHWAKDKMLKSVLSFFGHAKEEYIFPTVDPAEDGPDCKKDCADCTVQYPARFNVETTRKLYGHIKPFATHVLVATGKSDWKEKVEREKGSLMEALHDTPVKAREGVGTRRFISTFDK